MAKDYKFVMHCWQDQYGDENATANIFVNGTQVGTNVEITATAEGSHQTVTFEAPGLADPAADDSVTADIKVVLTNEAYVDGDNDRNIWIKALYCVYKDTGAADYKYLTKAKYDSLAGNATTSDLENVTDSVLQDVSETSALWFRQYLATNVQGSQIESTWWADEAVANSSWYHIPVWGDESNVGTTITVPLTR